MHTQHDTQHPARHTAAPSPAHNACMCQLTIPSLAVGLFVYELRLRDLVWWAGVLSLNTTGVRCLQGCVGAVCVRCVSLYKCVYLSTWGHNLNSSGVRFSALFWVFVCELGLMHLRTFHPLQCIPWPTYILPMSMHSTQHTHAAMLCCHEHR